MHKNLFKIFLFICLFGLPLQGFSSQENNLDYKIEGEKIYLESPSQVIMNTKGIFFCVDGEFFRTDAIYHDESGFFVPLAPLYWICKNGHINPMYRYPCSKCGAGMPGT